jgi:hypothetical protein
MSVMLTPVPMLRRPAVLLRAGARKAIWRE